MTNQYSGSIDLIDRERQWIGLEPSSYKLHHHHNNVFLLRARPATMAGPNPNLTLDPALQKYYELNVNRYKYFRWTPRTVWISFCYMALVPGVLAYVGYKTDGKFEFRGKRRGDTIVEW